MGAVVLIVCALCALCALAAVASLLYGLTAEDDRYWQRLVFCLLAILLGAVPTAAIYVGEKILREFADGLDHRTASIVATTTYSIFSLGSLVGAFSRPKKPNKAPEPTPGTVTPRAKE